MSVALGVNFHHDTAACLIVDGQITAAEEERWSGLKHNRTRREDYLSAPDQALRYCLDAAGITAAEVDTVWAASMAPPPATGAWASTEHAQLARLLPPPLGRRLRLLSHHTAHVLSAFPLAGVDRAAGLVIDAGGQRAGRGPRRPRTHQRLPPDLVRMGTRPPHPAQLRTRSGRSPGAPQLMDTLRRDGTKAVL